MLTLKEAIQECIIKAHSIPKGKEMQVHSAFKDQYTITETAEGHTLYDDTSEGRVLMVPVWRMPSWRSVHSEGTDAWKGTVTRMTESHYERLLSETQHK